MFLRGRTLRMASKKNFYAVVRGRKPGIYKEWFGANGAEVQVKAFPDALYKGFVLRNEAEQWFQEMSRNANSQLSLGLKTPQAKATQTPQIPDFKPDVLLFTDGGCLNNPGPGGYGIVRQIGNAAKEFSGGFRLTTNNRMELLACIVGLQSLKMPNSKVHVITDSKYVVNGITKGWAARWRQSGWKRNKEEFAENIDLWAQLLDLCEQHQVHFKWVKGHAGHKENERCDKLAKKAAKTHGLPKDENYEANRTQVPGFK